MVDFPQRKVFSVVWIGFFLGPFGAHRFYTGYKASAFLQFVLCGLSTLWLCTDVWAVFAAAYHGELLADALWDFMKAHWLHLLLLFPVWGVGVAWVSLDMARIVAGRFKDALGRPLLTSDEAPKA